jgi:phospho-N-acetylmuramoyl-pentapeptide-transferase
MIQSYLLVSVITLAVGIGLGFALIPLLRKMKFGQSIREEGPKRIWQNLAHPLWAD